jgi:RNA polymerase sigma-70 factor (ECF subfamily)
METESEARGAVDASSAARGDLRAFERLYREHVGRVMALARRLIGPDEAVEITQDVFVRAWQKIGSFRGEAAFGTWLHRVAVNVMLTRRAELGKRRQRFDDSEGALEQIPVRGPHSDHRIDFEGAIVHLPEGARQVFVLHDVEGYKHDEIATLLGVTTGTTKAQLHRARMLMRRHLEA